MKTEELAFYRISDHHRLTQIMALPLVLLFLVYFLHCSQSECYEKRNRVKPLISFHCSKDET